MKKTRIVFVEASLEPVPKSLWRHPSVESDSKRRRRHPSRILLYIPIHYTAMKDNGVSIVKRGRPDILHRMLIMTLDSPLARERLLEIYVHTIDNKIIWVNPEMRVPLDYYRFEGIVIQLFKKGVIPPDGDPIFMKIIDTDLRDLLKDNGRRMYLLSKDGVEANVDKAKEMIGNTIVVGAFQEGEFRRDIIDLADEKISISPYTQHASTAVCSILTYMYMGIRGILK